jgi:hypothetical protein
LDKVGKGAYVSGSGFREIFRAWKDLGQNYNFLANTLLNVFSYILDGFKDSPQKPSFIT